MWRRNPSAFLVPPTNQFPLVILKAQPLAPAGLGLKSLLILSYGTSFSLLYLSEFRFSYLQKVDSNNHHLIRQWEVNNKMHLQHLMRGVWHSICALINATNMSIFRNSSNVSGKSYRTSPRKEKPLSRIGSNMVEMNEKKNSSKTTKMAQSPK